MTITSLGILSSMQGSVNIKNCIRLPLIYWLFFIALIPFTNINDFRDLLARVYLAFIPSFVLSLFTWPSFYFILSMPFFRKVKKEMSAHYHIVHSDCACIYDETSSKTYYNNVYFSGYFFMTETAIIFRRDFWGAFGYASDDTYIYFSSISNIEKCRMFPRINGRHRNLPIFVTNGIRIGTNSGHGYKLIIGEREKIISQITAKTSHRDSMLKY